MLKNEETVNINFSNRNILEPLQLTIDKNERYRNLLKSSIVTMFQYKLIKLRITQKVNIMNSSRTSLSLKIRCQML